MALIMLSMLAGCGKKPSSSTGTNDIIPPPVQGGINADAPIQKLDYNPLTGGDLPAGYEAGMRPVAIMVNNAAVALPQRGIASADTIFEMVTEGGVTRLMAMYSFRDAIPQVGPVRSARDQHLQMALPLNAIYVHIGSSIYASNLLNEYHYQDVDGMYLGSTSFVFDTERSKTRSNEHCWYTDATLIRGGIDKNAVPLTGAFGPLFSFVGKAEPVRIPVGGDALDAKWQYSASSEVEFVYNPETKMYLKSAYAAPHIDELTGEQLSFTNVLLLVDDVSLKADGQCAQFAMLGGKGFYFTNGKYEEITWKKGNADAPLKLLNIDGSEVKINIGKSYIGVLGSTQMETFVPNVVAPPPEVVPPEPAPTEPVATP
ncbi:MAG: DUF3048 domain-containing protein [Oscillospiraceae bacterium]